MSYTIHFLIDENPDSHSSLTMALPLHTFMQDLLRAPEHRDHAYRVALVVDNARVAGKENQQRSSRRRFHSKVLRWEKEYQQKFHRKPSKKDALDISDHSKKDSRWESTMTKSEGKSNSPGAPLRSPSNHRPSSSPRKTMFVKDLSPVCEEQRKQRRLSRKERNAGGTMHQVEEAIAICSKVY